MRRLLLPALLIAMLSVSAPWALAQIDAGSTVAQQAKKPTAAPMRAPAAAPHQLADRPEGFAYRTTAQIAATLPGSDQAAAASANNASASGATITVTATVLPTATIVVTAGGSVDHITINTPERSAANIVYVARRGSDSGAIMPINDVLWTTSIRPALALLHGGSGTVYNADA